MRPAEAFLEVLHSEGVDRIFGNPGTTEVPLLEALVDAPDLPYTLGLQEGSVVAMADGYARVTGRASAVNLHVAAGTANGLIGMLNAARSRTPMVVTVGQQDRRHLLEDPMLSGDVVGIAAAVAKSAIEVQHAADLPLVLRRAFATARRAPAGPVVVSIPMDLLDEDLAVSVPARSTPVPQGVAAGIDDALAVLSRSRRPAIVAGDAVGRAGAVDELVAVAEALGATTFHQPMFDGLDFPTDHPLYAGSPLPTNADIRAHLEPHDVVLIVGCHAFMPHHYSAGSAIPEGTRVVQLDEDAAEIGRNFAVEVGLVGDLGATLRSLASDLDGSVDDASARRAVAERDVHERRAAQEAELADRPHGSPLDPLRAAHAIASSLPPDARIVEEAITAGMLLRRMVRLRRPGSYLHTVGGGLGWGIGAAVGARLGDPTRPVLAVLGDGCAMFGLQGLWSAAHEGTPVTFLVMANNEYRTLKETIDRRAGAPDPLRTYVGLDFSEPAIDWLAAGRAFGIEARRTGSLEELSAVVGHAGTREAPLLVEVPITAHGMPTTSSDEVGSMVMA